MAYRIVNIALAALLGIVLASCSSDGGGSVSSTEDAGPQTNAAETQADDGTDRADDAAAAGGGFGRGMAIITFDNGEVLSTAVLCALEPQIAAGQEILFSATATASPFFDVTEFGADTQFAGGSVEWYETEDFETYTAAWRGTESAGNFEVNLDGTTISGAGTFVSSEGPDAGTSREGNFEVNCL